ncbi:PfkB family carbohydrate kinase [Actinomyces dentalis]|uniref:PfkB family carbohydrate kinase n=1 Tax=Actinomyces dentalis TaxID=272548 RepID=UPI0028EA9E10|nr:PfkB family carbohydrate kinase [Actinomyces dentalis]
MTEQCRGACLSAWERRSEWPLTAIALAFLAVYAWEVIADLHGAERAGTELAMNAMWAVFIVDYLVRLALAPQRGRWFVRHLFDLAVVALPVLRPLRLVRLIALIGVLHRGAGMALRGRITAYTAGGVTLLVLVSSLAVLDAERGAPGTPIRTYGEAVWWALATITTVGYGDLAPVTAVGRWAAVLLMIGGVALAGVVTATLASWIVSLVAEESAEQEAATRAQVEVLQRQVTALIERVEHLGADRSTRAAAPDPGSEAGAGVRAGAEPDAKAGGGTEAGAGVRAGAEPESGPDAEPGAGARPVRPVRPVGLFVGLAVLDVIQLVEAPPGPDEKIVALDQAVAAGGPAANAAVAFAALGGRALLAAPVGAGPLAELIRADLTAHGVELIDCAAAPTARGAAAAGPSVSSCTITAATGERSVVSTNARARPDPAPLSALSDAVAAGAPAPDVVLIDGHNPPLARIGLDLAERVGALRLMDAGSWKDDAADLPGRCDVVAPSARFHPPGPAGALREPAAVAAWLRGRGAGAVVLTRGSAPVLWWCGERSGSAAPPAVEAVDTLGAGDVFHGALALALARALPGRRFGGGGEARIAPAALAVAVASACAVAAASTEHFGTRAWIAAMPRD